MVSILVKIKNENDNLNSLKMFDAKISLNVFEPGDPVSALQRMSLRLEPVPLHTGEKLTKYDKMHVQY